MKKGILITACLIFSLLFIYFLVTNFLSYFGAGSYPNAESYTINVSESTLIDAINRFKNENPQFAFPNRGGSTNMYLPRQGKFEDHLNNQHDYVVYFYIKEEDQVFYTFTSPESSDRVIFCLVRFYNSGTWKDINRPFSFWDSRKRKKDFEEKILQPILKLLPPSTQLKKHT